MAKLFLTPIDMGNLEVQNLRLHQSQPAVAILGGAYFNTTSSRLAVYTAAAAWETVPVIGAGNPAGLTVAGAVAVGTSLYAARLDHAHAMPGLATGAADGFMPTADKSKLDAATSANTVSTLVMRDAASRFRAANPSDIQDVATKGYVDALVTGVADWHQSVHATTTAVLTITARTSQILTVGGTSFTIDNVVIPEGERVLIKDGTTGVSGAGAADNGIYEVSGVGVSIVLTRVLDMDTWLEVVGAAMFVENGDTYADTAWVCSSNDGGTLGTTAVTFVQFGGGASYSAADATGVTGTGVYDATVGNQFRFRAILAASTKISIALVTKDITIDVSEANLTLQNLGGTLTVGKGGTGVTTLASNGILYGNAAGVVQVTAASGAIGNVLKTVAAGGVPSWGSLDLSLVGTVGSSVLAIANGGTGASTAAAAKTSLGFMTRYVTNVGDGTNTTFALTHALGTLDVTIEVFRNSDGVKVECDVAHTDTNTLTVVFAVIPTTNQYRVVIIG